AEMNMALADELAELKRAVAVADRELAEARSKLTVLMAGGRPEEIDATRAEIANQAARRTGVLDHLRLVNIVSPITGVITTPKLRDKRGQLVGKGDLIATVHEMRTVNAEIRIPELEIADVQVGQRVGLKARAYPRSRFEGEASSIALVVSSEE